MKLFSSFLCLALTCGFTFAHAGIRSTVEKLEMISSRCSTTYIYTANKNFPISTYNRGIGAKSIFPAHEITEAKEPKRLKNAIVLRDYFDDQYNRPDANCGPLQEVRSYELSHSVNMSFPEQLNSYIEVKYNYWSKSISCETGRLQDKNNNVNLRYSGYLPVIVYDLVMNCDTDKNGNYANCKSSMENLTVTPFIKDGPGQNYFVNAATGYRSDNRIDTKALYNCLVTGIRSL